MRNRIILVTPVYLAVVCFVLFNTIMSSRLSQLVEASVVHAAEVDSAVASLKPPVKTVSIQPTRLVIPRLSIDITVLPGTYDVPTQQWTLTSRNAHVSDVTNKPSNADDGGLSFIYGHNNRFVLGKTKDLKKDDILQLYDEKGVQFTYRFVDAEVVSPTDTEFLSYTGKPRLVVMSCTGTWNESRRIMNFSLESVQEKK